MINRVPLPALTGLRFVAALSIAASHGATLALNTKSGGVFSVQQWLIVQGESLGMPLFFVLSGFVIHYNYQMLVFERSCSGILRFLWARFARLYPLFLLVLCIDTALSYHLWYEHERPLWDALLQGLPYVLLFVQSWFYKVIGHTTLSHVGIVLQITWSVSSEWFFYVVYPIIGLLLVRMQRRWIVALVTIAWTVGWTSVCITLYSHSPAIDAWAGHHFGPVGADATNSSGSFVRWLQYESPYIRIGEFILGCLVAQCYERMKPSPPGPREIRAGGIALVVALFSIPVMIFLMHSPTIGTDIFSKMQYNVGLAPSVAILIFCLIRYQSGLSRWLSCRLLISLGEASYSIYLVHWFIWAEVTGLAEPPLPVTAYNIAFLTGRFLLVLALIMLVSVMIYRCYEAPARRWMRRLWPSMARRQVSSPA
jgi:peptidoglycan/LPS O-acetylase OafA/YrhL